MAALRLSLCSAGSEVTAAWNSALWFWANFCMSATEMFWLSVEEKQTELEVNTGDRSLQKNEILMRVLCRMLRNIRCEALSHEGSFEGIFTCNLLFCRNLHLYQHPCCLGHDWKQQLWVSLNSRPERDKKKIHKLKKKSLIQIFFTFRDKMHNVKKFKIYIRACQSFCMC